MLGPSITQKFRHLLKILISYISIEMTTFKFVKISGLFLLMTMAVTLSTLV